MIATTLEQSKHLLELGLDPKTADMCFEMYKGNWTLNVGKKSAQVNRGLAIPAWSVDAMQKLLTSRIIIDNRYYDFDWTKTEKTYIYVYANSLEYRHEITANENSNAAYGMLCWLLENNFIEKSK